MYSFLRHFLYFGNNLLVYVSGPGGLHDPKQPLRAASLQAKEPRAGSACAQPSPVEPTGAPQSDSSPALGAIPLLLLPDFTLHSFPS